MLEQYSMLLFLAHIIGDFYLQDESMAKKKEKHLKWVFIHGLCYWLGVLIVTSVVMSRQVFVFGTGFAVLHALIDIVKYFVPQRKDERNEDTDTRTRNGFFIDQLAHFISVPIVAYRFTVSGGVLELCNPVRQVLEGIGCSTEDLRTLLIWFVVLLLIHKPVNIAITRILAPFKPRCKSDHGDDRNAGRYIGTLERMIMIALISLGQYSAIGLVLTAKSIARYDMITKDPGFSEYYLLGTLLSTLSVIVISVALLGLNPMF